MAFTRNLTPSRRSRPLCWVASWRPGHAHPRVTARAGQRPEGGARDGCAHQELGRL